MRQIPPIFLKSSPKGWRSDLDKVISPEETCRRVAGILANADLDILSSVRRIDTGRLGIPVYLSVCGADAREIMPVRKQMGKGSSPEQAKASALMELVERFSFFSFWRRQDNFFKAGWSEAKERFGDKLISVEEMLQSVSDKLPAETAEDLLNLHEWSFYPATRLETGETVWIPLDWFRTLGEFNGSSAGNSQEESILQGICELVERHVSCLADRQKAPMPTISPDSCRDPKLLELLETFRKNGVNLVMKDFSMGMPLPTVAALAWDPSTFPESSEIVFTAGTASSPAKAAIRAITEAAQLGGDFHTNSRYEASGLPKPAALAECAWILDGPEVSLDSLPSVEDADIKEEILSCLAGLPPLYAVDITHPLLNIPAHYCVGPGLQFRERARNQSLGLFIGRKLAEERPLADALAGLEKIAARLPDAPWLPFFRGLAYLNNGFPEKSLTFFKDSIPLQTDSEARAMAEFYTAYALSAGGRWDGAIPFLEAAVSHCGEVKEYFNLLGVALFKTGRFAEAEEAFSRALELDKGSAMDLANRGIARKLQGKKKEAAADLEAALQLDPSLSFAAAHLEELRSL